MQIRFFSAAILISILAAELPIGFTEEEWNNRHVIKDMGYRTDPPPAPVRAIAEYEPMQGVLIRYPLGISTSLVKELAEDVIVYCLVSSGLQNSAYNSFNSSNVNMNHVEFITGSTDSHWTRDYGPWWVVDGNGDFAIVDFTYNRPRPNDNQAPSKVATYLDVPYYSTDMVHTGGNYMTDGFGIAASTQIAYTENDACGTSDSWSIPLAPCNYVDNVMEEYYGINEYHVVADPNNEYIDHIDCWGKYLSSTKVLLRSVPVSHSQFSMIEDIVDYFETTTTSTGAPWEIFRVYTPSDQPYTNSLILNDKVFVPIMNSTWDDDAVSVYEEALPNHEIITFTGSWYSTDALHCRTRGIPDLTYISFQQGDVNGDDTINILDIVITVNGILGTTELTATQIQLADLNSDGNINILDIVLIVNLVLGGN